MKKHTILLFLVWISMSSSAIDRKPISDNSEGQDNFGQGEELESKVNFGFMSVAAVYYLGR